MATILIIDDSPTDVHVYGNMLKKNGFEVESASNAEDGIEMAKNTQPDLILMDVMLRWTDPVPPEEMPPEPAEVEEEGYYRAGIRCVRRLRKQEQTDPRIPILLFTILSDHDLSQDLLELNQDRYFHVAYLQKTAPVVDLIRKIKAVAPVLQTP